MDTVSTPMLLKVVLSGRLDPKQLVTHRFGLGDVMRAYDVFGNAAKERALQGDTEELMGAGANPRGSRFSWTPSCFPG